MMIAFRLIGVLAVVFGTAAAAVAQVDVEMRIDAVKEFRRYFRKFKQVDAKVEAVRTLEANECVEAATELVKLLDHRIPEVGRAAFDVLVSYRQAETFSALVEAAPEVKNQQRRAMLIDVFGRAGITSAASMIAAAVLDDRGPATELRYSVARSLGRLGGARAQEALTALLADGDAGVRMAACDSIGQLRLTALGQGLIQALGDSHWQVRITAAGALGRIREPAAVVPLIVLMRDGGRVVEDCADALFRITGLDLGTDADKWQRNWERLERIPGWRIPTDAELQKAEASRQRYAAIYGAAAANQFGGIKTTSTRILFIIDISGSMEDLVVQRDKFDADYPNFEKLTIVKTELSRTIESLESGTEFNIAAFATEIKPWKPSLVPANVVNKASARDWIRKLEALGGKAAQGLATAGLTGTANLAAGKTNTHGALLYPFGIDPSKPRNATVPMSKRGLDTVFFLSDGRPSTGKLVDEREILREVTELNDQYRITFHVIAIGDFQKNFLRSLAEQNYGVFVDLGH